MCNRFSKGGHDDGEAMQVVAMSGQLRRNNDDLLDAITEGSRLPITSKGLHNVRRAKIDNGEILRAGDLWTDSEETSEVMRCREQLNQCHVLAETAPE